MIGVDIHEGMLAEAKIKTTDCKKVKWLQQDCLQLNIEDTISLAFMVGMDSSISLQIFIKINY